MNISVQQLNEMRQKGEDHVLLDVRENEELAIASLDGVLHIPMSALLERVEEIPNDKPIVVMCHLGGRSAQVQGWMLQNGFENVLNLDGGITAWSAHIDPNMPRY